MQDFAVTTRLAARIISLAAAFGIHDIIVTEVRLRVVNRLGTTAGIPQRNFAQGDGRTRTAEVSKRIVRAMCAQSVQFVVVAKEPIRMVALLTTATGI